MSDNDALKSIYYNPKHSAGFASVNKLVKASGQTPKQVKAWLKSQPTYTLHTNARKTYPTRHYVVHDIDEQWQADLADVSLLSRRNKGHHFILTVIDLFSRYAWARPLKSKHGKEVAAAFKNIFREGRIPKRIQTDQGKEFENRQVRTLFQRHDIELFSVKSAYKAAVVERFNRTLKTRIWRYFTANNTSQWTHVLQDAVHAYNHSVHRMIGYKPADVTANVVDELRDKMHQRKKPARGQQDIRVGDKVRISKVKSVFAKGYLPNWTEEIFTVAEVNTKHMPTMYTLKDAHGDVIEGSFYRYEIQPITKEDDVFLVEKVVRRQKREGEVWLLVKWLGYPTRMNSWVRQSDVLSLMQIQNREEN